MRFGIALLFVGVMSGSVMAQVAPSSPSADNRVLVTPATKSPGKAFLLSLAVPGLGHRYVHDGSWKGMASAYALADAGLWLGWIHAEWKRDQVVQSYTTLAARRAAADVVGKDRLFFLNLASYLSSEEYRESKLRARAWDEVDYVADPAFQWEWASAQDFQEFIDLRDEADSWKRRRVLFLSTLVANRLIAGVTALRSAQNTRTAASNLSLSISPPAPSHQLPVLNLAVRW